MERMDHLATWPRSRRHRLARRRLSPYVWGVRPVISPYLDRLQRAAFGDHVCRPFPVRLTARP